MLLTDEKISHSLDAMKTQYFENKGFHISISLLKVQICRYILYKIFMHLQSWTLLYAEIYLKQLRTYAF